MVTANRLGTWALLAGGLMLGGLMVYTLVGVGPGNGPAGAGAGGVAEVAVFFTEKADWLDVRDGVAACARRKLVRPREQADGEIVVETPAGRAIRFTWQRARGRAETEAAVRDLVARPEPPVAFLGAANTFWTEVLAEALRSATAGDSQRSPVLLVPWATSVWAEPSDGRPGRERLLDVYPGRTFRFAPNNRREADLVIGCLVDREPDLPPGRVVVVVDRADPYSVDMAEAFTDAVEAAAPKAELVESSGALAFPESAFAREESWAEAVWYVVREAPAGQATWVVLPLQDEPSRRLIAALRDRARAEAPADVARLRVVCGDAQNRDVLAEMAGHDPFEVWAISSASLRGPAAADGPSAQVLAEIVAALAVALDRSEPGADLRDALARLDIPADGRAAVAGRSIAFDPSGERRGDDLGHVLMIRPGEAAVLGFDRGPGGRWSEAEPWRPPAVEARR